MSQRDESDAIKLKVPSEDPQKEPEETKPPRSPKTSDAPQKKSTCVFLSKPLNIQPFY